MQCNKPHDKFLNNWQKLIEGIEVKCSRNNI